MDLFFRFLVVQLFLNNTVLLINRSHLSIVQASSSFKRLDTRMIMYPTPIFITEALRLITWVKLQLLQMN